MRVTQHEHALAAVVARCAASCHAGARAQASIIRGESSLIQSRRPLIQTSVRSSVSRLMDGSAGWQQEHALGAVWASCAASARRPPAARLSESAASSNHHLFARLPRFAGLWWSGGLGASLQTCSEGAAACAGGGCLDIDDAG